MDSEEVKSSEKKAEGSRKKSIGKKRAGNEQKQESSMLIPRLDRFFMI
ncbi:hypothetical protein Tco_0687219, partial [Tanacetum coccineum]